MKYILNLQEIEKYYTITEDGKVFNKLTKRWMSPYYNNYGYVYVCITHGVDHVRNISAHTLVIYKFVGPPPTPKHEVNHINGNRADNYYKNLEWVTHSQNQLKAYQGGREHWWLGKTRPSPALVTRLLMANAKKKKVQFKSDNQTVIYDSIEDAASQLQTYRKKIYNCIKDNKPIKGGSLSFIYDEPAPELCI